MESREASVPPHNILLGGQALQKNKLIDQSIYTNSSTLILSKNPECIHPHTIILTLFIT